MPDASNDKLRNPPLVEAWLEIRWMLHPISETETVKIEGSVQTDEGFPFALGNFYNQVREKYGFRKDLPASHAPLHALPHIVRHQFWRGEEQWPLLQLGPGVATVNFAENSYSSWPEFKREALFLRSQLVEAYADFGLEPQRIALFYRNVEPFDFSSENALSFLAKKLNTTISLPDHAPGSVGEADRPATVNLEISYVLNKPRGRGWLQIATAEKAETVSNETIKKENILFELRVMSFEDDVPYLQSEDDFEDWLTSAHDVIHEWFFALIDGELRAKYE